MQKSEWKPRKAEAKSAAANRWWISLSLILILFGVAAGGAVWWRYNYPPEDPQVAKVKALQRQVLGAMESPPTPTNGQAAATENALASRTPPSLTSKEREAMLTQLRAEMEKLTEEQRDEVRRSMGDSFRDRMRATIQEYRALPKEKRAAFLDKQIDEMEQRRAQFERGGRGGNNAGPAGNSRGRDAQTGGNSGASPGGAGGNSGRDRGPPSPERRLEWRRNMLANTTPQERAEAEMYFSDINARREARGLEPMGPGRR